jgi:D-amino-acid dehydrogenase
VAKRDVLVLGAGMVGVSAALHLTKRGVSVTLVDRRGAGEETSYGNAGLIEASRMMPIGFPRALRDLVRYGFGFTPHANFHWAALPGLAPFLLRYWAASRADRLDASARALRPMLAAAPAEHAELAGEAGASRLIRKAGLLKVFRSENGADESIADRAFADEFGVPYQSLTRDEVEAREPHLLPIFKSGQFWPETGNCSDPGGLVKSYAALFEKLGGVFVKADARSLHKYSGGWRVETDSGPLDAKEVVIAAGPWSMEIAEKFGVRVPFAVKRGYHMHFKAKGNATLSSGVLDVEGGYAMLPMDRGIRITTGVEFARRDAPPTPVQLGKALPKAKELFPLGEAIEDKPWMGARPATPDSLPVVGPVSGQPGLWVAFGHSHLGFTLGPPTGRMLAEMMTGAKPTYDPAPLRIDRF